MLSLSAYDASRVSSLGDRLCPSHDNTVVESADQVILRPCGTCVHWNLTDAQSVVIEGPESEHLRMTHFGGSFDLGKLLLDQHCCHPRRLLFGEPPIPDRTVKGNALRLG